MRLYNCVYLSYILRICFYLVHQLPRVNATAGAHTSSIKTVKKFYNIYNLLMLIYLSLFEAIVYVNKIKMTISTITTFLNTPFCLVDIHRNKFTIYISQIRIFLI